MLIEFKVKTSFLPDQYYQAKNSYESYLKNELQ